MLQCGTDNEQLKIELLSQWKLEAEFRNNETHQLFQICKMEAFMGKWKMDYSACEGYDEFMAAEVVLPDYYY